MSFHPMLTLWSIADPAKLTNEVLEDIRSESNVSHQLGYLAEVVEDIGCLVAADKNAGNFTSTDDFPTLMFSLSSTISNLSAMAWVSNEANAILKHRANSSEVKS